MNDINHFNLEILGVVEEHQISLRMRFTQKKKKKKKKEEDNFFYYLME